MPFDGAVPVDDPIAKICERATDLLEQKGWTQYALKNHRGQMCMLGALHTAAGHRVRAHTLIAEHERLAPEIGAALRRLGFRSRTTAAAWNDRQCRTLADVIARLRAAAEKKEDQHAVR